MKDKSEVGKLTESELLLVKTWRSLKQGMEEFREAPFCTLEPGEQELAMKMQRCIDLFDFAFMPFVKECAELVNKVREVSAKDAITLCEYREGK